MEYNYYLIYQKEINKDECLSSGICPKSPTLVYLHELIITYEQELAFYLLKLKALGITNEQIKEDILNAFSSTMVNVEYDEEQFFSIISKLYNNLTQAKELYISVCKRNDLKADIFKSSLKLPQAISFSEAVIKGQKIFKKRFEKFNKDQINLFELMLCILKSICIHMIELRDLGINDDVAYDSILKLLSIEDLYDTFKENVQNIVQEFVELDNELLMKLAEIREEKFGKMLPVKVSLSTRPNKAILVSGTNLRELDLVLEATKDKGIDVYTHGHLVTAHAYPYFKKYPHLVGNFGKEIDSYLLDFAAFPGAVFITKHSFRTLKNLFRSRVFTTDVIAPKGINLIKNHNFDALIESALNAKGFTKSTKEGFINISLDENVILKKTNEIADKVKIGEIKNIFTIGVSNNKKDQKDYFTRFLNLLDETCFAFSFSYTNNKKNVLLIETDYGFPLLFKIIEIFKTKIGLENINLTVCSTRCETHTISSVIYLKSLGVKNIYFGDCSPTLINPSLIDFFREKFELKSFTLPDVDFKEITKES